MTAQFWRNVAKQFWCKKPVIMGWSTKWGWVNPAGTPNTVCHPLGLATTPQNTFRTNSKGTGLFECKKHRIMGWDAKWWPLTPQAHPALGIVTLGGGGQAPPKTNLDVTKESGRKPYQLSSFPSDGQAFYHIRVTLHGLGFRSPTYFTVEHNVPLCKIPR